MIDDAGRLVGLADGRVLAVGANGADRQIYDPERDRWFDADAAGEPQIGTP